LERDPERAAYAHLATELKASFEQGHLDSAMRTIFGSFGRAIDSLDAVFKDDQGRLVERLLAPTLADVESAHRALFERHAPLLRRLAPLRSQTPRALLVAGELVLSADLLRATEQIPPDVPMLRRLFAQAKEQDLRVDRAAVSFALGRSVTALVLRLFDLPLDPARCAQIDEALEFAQRAGLRLDLWPAQNYFYRAMHLVYPQSREEAEVEDLHPRAAEAWCSAFESLAERLRIRLPPPESLRRLALVRGEALEELGWK